MFSKIFHNTIRYSFIPFSSLFGKSPDDIPISQLKINPNEIPEETGWDRVQKMYTVE